MAGNSPQRHKVHKGGTKKIRILLIQWAIRLAKDSRCVVICDMAKTVKGRVGWAVVKKVLKAIPIIGPVFVVGFAGHDIKKKGLVAGAVHVGLDATPVVGTAKNVLEIFTGDLIPDKADRLQTNQTSSHPPVPPNQN